MGLLWSKPFVQTKMVILISGASSGIGKETALTLLKRGHVVYGTARRVDRMQDLVQAGGHVMSMDVQRPEQVVSCVRRIIEEQGKIDVLVNNAGFAVYGAVEDVDMEEARQQFEVNLFGLARLTKEVLPHMRNQRHGTIINMSSIVGQIYIPFGSWYIASKHALEGWSDTLRLELKPFNINVVVIEPNTIKTEHLENLKKPMLHRSKGGPYESYVQQFANGYETMDATSPMASEVAKVVVRAAESRNPRRRYVAGKMTATIIFMRKAFDGPIFDKIITSAFKTKIQ